MHAPMGLPHVIRLAGRRLCVLMIHMSTLVPGTALAQTDFYNLDHGHPLRAEDAYAIERWAIEIQGSPLALSQERSGPLRFAPGAELKYGLLPGMELSAGTSMEIVREGSDSNIQLGDVRVSSLFNLWVEGRFLPALGVRVTGAFPTESGESSTVEGVVIITRTLTGPVRAHLNGGLARGRGREENWWGGVALDYVLPFRHLLLLAETWVSSPEEGRKLFHSSVGARVQLTPTIAADAGLGRSWTGHPREDWAITLGVARQFGVRALMPGADQ
jgi:hypothetical protein